jgi:type I restriction enzyme S subunit
MKSNYEPLGKFIKEVKTRNADLGAKELLGINIDKFFMPSVANIVGVDLSKYKLVKQNQFACNRMHVGRDGRIPVALSTRVAPFIVSPAYDVFEIKDPTELLPEYLMMWFSRREFDRNAWFYTDADVRGGLAWQAFCNMALPVPSPEKQREIVAEYHTIQNRIALNNQLIQTLETTAQAIYKQWFVEFEFPNEAGQPYKSSGGEMIESELGEIPEGWRVGKLADVVHDFISHRGKSKSAMNMGDKSQDLIHPVISAMNINEGRIVKRNIIKYVSPRTYNGWMKYSLAIDDVIMTSEAPMGQLYYLAKRSDFVLSQRLFAFRVNRRLITGLYLYFWLNNKTAKVDLEGRASGTTVLGIKLSELKKLVLLQPDINTIDDAQKVLYPILSLVEEKHEENQLLTDIMNLLLSKLATIETAPAVPKPAAIETAQLTLSFA